MPLWQTILPLQYHFYIQSETKGQAMLSVDVLSRLEVEQLIGACTEGASGVRNKAILTLMYRTGLRVSECLNLRVTDITGVACTVRRGKGGKRRVVGVDSWAQAAIGAWLGVRPPIGLYLFTTLQGKRLSTAYMRALCKRLARKAGIAKRVHPHGFRHSFASDAALTLPLPILQGALGHSNLATTARYVHGLNPHLIIEAMAVRG